MFSYSTLNIHVKKYCTIAATALFSIIIYSLQLQLFLAIAAIPILISWGLPLSLMSCIGNIIFNPFLSIFLVVSCCIFFLELLSLPNTWFIACLEYITLWWDWLIAQGSKKWLMYFQKPPLIVLVILPSIALLFIMKKQWHTKRILCTLACVCIALLGVAWLYTSYCRQTIHLLKVPCGSGYVTLVKTGTSITLIDPGVMGKRINTSWVEYTLLKTLSMEYGSTTIDHVVCIKPGILTFEYLAQLCTAARVKHVYLPLWHGTTEKRLNQRYGIFKRTLELEKGTLIRIGKKTITLPLSSAVTLTLQPTVQRLTYHKTFCQDTCIQLADTRNKKITVLHPATTNQKDMSV